MCRNQRLRIAPGLSLKDAGLRSRCSHPCIQERQEGASGGRALCPHLLGRLCPDRIGQSWATWPSSCQGAWRVGARDTVNPQTPSLYLSLSPHFNVFLLPVALPGAPQWTVHGLLGPCCWQAGARDAQRGGQDGNRRAQLPAPLGSDWEVLDPPGLPRNQVEVALTYCPAHTQTPSRLLLGTLVCKQGAG